MNAKSHSHLLNYIALLLHDDDALMKFTVDPITTAEQHNNLTKAERAVLRRALHGLSNNSVNGYSMARNLSSYRRSLRLLQNVLINTGSKMAMDLADTNGSHPYALRVYYPNISVGDTDFTCKTNQDVENFGGPYINQIMFPVVRLSRPTATIKEIMDATNVQYSTVKNADGEEYVSAISIFGNTITADLSHSCYRLNDPNNPNPDNVFWFYSINGRANPRTSGSAGESFASKVVQEGSVIEWQLIAPDAQYGFYPCGAHEDNAFGKAKQLAQSS